MLANLLNKKNAVARKEMSEQDAIKYVLDNNASGINWNADINVKALKLLDLTAIKDMVKFVQFSLKQNNSLILEVRELIMV